MKRNEITTIDKLAIGDRFYFASDKHKVVWEKVDGDTKRTPWQTYTQWALPGEIADRPNASDEYKRQSKKSVRKQTQVVYLRSK